MRSNMDRKEDKKMTEDSKMEENNNINEDKKMTEDSKMEENNKINEDKKPSKNKNGNKGKKASKKKRKKSSKKNKAPERKSLPPWERDNPYKHTCQTRRPYSEEHLLEALDYLNLEMATNKFGDIPMVRQKGGGHWDWKPLSDRLGKYLVSCIARDCEHLWKVSGTNDEPEYHYKESKFPKYDYDLAENYLCYENERNPWAEHFRGLWESKYGATPLDDFTDEQKQDLEDDLEIARNFFDDLFELDPALPKEYTEYVSLHNAACFVARAFEPGVQIKGMPALTGGPDCGKSEYLDNLFDQEASEHFEYVGDLDFSDATEKEYWDTARGKIFLYTDESPPQGRKSQSKFKRRTTQTRMSGREAYAKRNSSYKATHHSAICTNDVRFMSRDPASQKRYFPLPVVGRGKEKPKLRLRKIRDAYFRIGYYLAILVGWKDDLASHPEKINEIRAKISSGHIFVDKLFDKMEQFIYANVDSYWIYDHGLTIAFFKKVGLFKNDNDDNQKFKDFISYLDSNLEQGGWTERISNGETYYMKGPRKRGEFNDSKPDKAVRDKMKRENDFTKKGFQMDEGKYTYQFDIDDDEDAPTSCFDEPNVTPMNPAMRQKASEIPGKIRAGENGNHREMTSEEVVERGKRLDAMMKKDCDAC